MKSVDTLRILTLAIVVSFVTGCRLELMVSSGGDVVSSNPLHHCSGGNFCEFDISTAPLPFSESFTVTARPGYEFVKWQDGAGFLCPGSTSPTCTVSVGDNELGAAILVSFESAYLMPVFKDLQLDTDGDGISNSRDDNDDNDAFLDVDDSCPLDSTNQCFDVVAFTDDFGVSSEWIQPDFFVNLSWNQIDASCPPPVFPEVVRVCSGMLNGYDLTGWIWASVDDVNTAMNVLIGFTALPLTGVPGFYAEVGSLWAPSIFDELGIRSTFESIDVREVEGWLATEANVEMAYSGELVDMINPTYPDQVDSGVNYWKDIAGPGIGAWFFRVLPP